MWYHWWYTTPWAFLLPILHCLLTSSSKWPDISLLAVCNFFFFIWALFVNSPWFTFSFARFVFVVSFGEQYFPLSKGKQKPCSAAKWIWKCETNRELHCGTLATVSTFPNQFNQTDWAVRNSGNQWESACYTNEMKCHTNPNDKSECVVQIHERLSWIIWRIVCVLKVLSLISSGPPSSQ